LVETKMVMVKVFVVTAGNWLSDLFIGELDQVEDFVRCWFCVVALKKVIQTMRGQSVLESVNVSSSRASTVWTIFWEL